MNELEKKSEVINPNHEHRNMKSTHAETKNHSQQHHQAHHDLAMHHRVMIADFKSRFTIHNQNNRRTAKAKGEITVRGTNKRKIFETRK